MRRSFDKLLTGWHPFESRQWRSVVPLDVVNRSSGVNKHKSIIAYQKPLRQLAMLLDKHHDRGALTENCSIGP